ncbi:MAG TPA: PBP1A family penicillin-binding protein [Acidimicrobiales bacterium]|nr:PBP1A family penicillin-binding protein [Acidimicrobiales bacterium]
MRRLIALLAALAVAAGACSWKTKPLAVDDQALAESSRIYTADGTLLATLHAEENRESVSIDAMPKTLQDAVVAIEDARFWQHKGVDAKSVVRAVYANTKSGKVVEGGSTITQQYVKNELVGNDRNARRKLREAALAYQLERKYTKAKILELYLNSIYFGNGAYGVQAAAHTYFGVSVDKLDLAQSALLAGLIRAPSTTDPYDHRDAAVARRKQVLDKMVEQGLVPPDQADQAAAQPLLPSTTPPGDQYAAPYFVERVKKFILEDPRFGATPAERKHLLFAGGLRIETTLDLAKQAEAEDAVAKVLSKPGTDPSAAVVSIEPRTGYVRALVGGRDFFGGGPQAKFDLATQGTRPAGSSFKPFVLAAALEKGVPLTKVYDAPAHIDIPLTRQTWSVENYEGETLGRMNLIDATVHSSNTVFAQLIMDVGPADAVAMAAKMGITSPLLPYPSAVLGTNDVSPYEMADAYATFANRGLQVTPTLVTRVLDSNGSVIYEHEHAQRRVMKQETADAVTDVLRQVVDRGTGVDARIGRPVAGKTGTGEEWRDAWFVGFTPDLVTSVWVGFPKGQISMVPPTTRIRVLGGTWPAQIWQLYMSKALAAVPESNFAPPPPLVFGAEQPLATVTNVLGMPVDQAEAALSRDGFQAVRLLKPSDQYPPGYVIDESPAAGSQAPGGSAVTVTVASGPASATVPDELDATEAAAVKAITDAGLVAKVIRQQEPKSPGAASRAGKVWKQTPVGGTRGDRNMTVTIWVNPGTPASTSTTGGP